MARHFEFEILSVGRVSDERNESSTTVKVERVGGYTRTQHTVYVTGHPTGAALEISIKMALQDLADKLAKRDEEHELVGKTYRFEGEA